MQEDLIDMTRLTNEFDLVTLTSIYQKRAKEGHATINYPLRGRSNLHEKTEEL